MATDKTPWIDRFHQLEKHVETTNDVPTNHHPIFGNFMRKQRVLFNKEITTGIIKNEDKHALWKKFMEDNKARLYKYPEWLKELKDIETFIENNNVEEYNTVSKWINKGGSTYKHGKWIQKNNDLYELTNKIMKDNAYGSLSDVENNEEHAKQVGIMVLPQAYNTWKTFKQGPIYKKHFMNTVDEWYDNAEKLKEYVVKNKKYPNHPSTEKKNKSDEEVIKLAVWMASQKRRKNEGSVENRMMYAEWQKFIVDNKC